MKIWSRFTIQHPPEIRYQPSGHRMRFLVTRFPSTSHPPLVTAFFKNGEWWIAKGRKLWFKPTHWAYVPEISARTCK